MKFVRLHIVLWRIVLLDVLPGVLPLFAQDRAFSWVIPPRYNLAFDFADHGLARGRVRDSEGEDRWGFINEKGEEVIPPCLVYAWEFANGLAVVKVNDKYGYILIS